MTLRLKKNKMNTEKTIRDIMTTEIVAVSTDDIFLDVKVLFYKNDFHHFLIFKN